MKNWKKHRRSLIVLLAISILIVIAMQTLDLLVLDDSLSSVIIRDTSVRIIIGTTLIIISVFLGYSFFKVSPYSRRKVLLWGLPGLIIAFNNFPISAVLAGRAELTQPGHTVILFAIECLSIGLLEEVVFRGIIFIAVLQRLPQNKQGHLLAILVSSALFGFVHLFNLAVGASLPSTLLQVVYSFAMGSMWAVVFLATENLMIPILLHAVYNFCGQVLTRLGTVSNQFDLVTILITTFLAVITVGFYLLVFLRLKATDVERII